MKIRYQIKKSDKMRYTRFEIFIKTKLLDDVKTTIQLPNCLADVSADENFRSRCYRCRGY